MDKNNKHVIIKTDCCTTFNFEVDGKKVHLGDVLCDQYGEGKVIGFGKGDDGYAIVFLARHNGIFPRHVGAMSLPDSWEKLRDDIASTFVDYPECFRGSVSVSQGLADKFIKRAKVLGKEGK